MLNKIIVTAVVMAVLGGGLFGYVKMKQKEAALQARNELLLEQRDSALAAHDSQVVEWNRQDSLKVDSLRAAEAFRIAQEERFRNLARNADGIQSRLDSAVSASDTSAIFAIVDTLLVTVAACSDALEAANDARLIAVSRSILLENALREERLQHNVTRALLTEFRANIPKPRPLWLDIATHTGVFLAGVGLVQAFGDK